jgi:very-short-patch-repair endonuclease
VPPVEQVIEELAPSRHGIVSIGQFRGAGVGDGRRDHALHRGTIVPVHRGVYRPTGVRLGPEAELRAACDATGPHAVVSHRSALWLWELIEQPDLIELSVPLTRRSSRGGFVVHRSADLVDDHCCVRRGLPVTKPARSLVDAAAVLSKSDLKEAVEQALIDRLVTVAGLRHLLDDVGRPGRRGAGALRRYLDARALADARPESQLEPLMARLCRDHGVAPVHFQRSVCLGGRTYRPDFQIPDALVAIEVDGFAAHGTRDALTYDLRRQNDFIRHGWLVLRYTRSDLRRPAQVAREIIEVATRRREELRRTS